jgi:hypothetical protein
MIKDEALNMSIELMERFLDYDGISSSDYIDVLDACKEALEQPTVAKLNDEYLRDTYVEGLNQPAQEPQYLYVYKSENNRKIHFSTGKENNVLLEYIGKIKLEVDDD